MHASDCELCLLASALQRALESGAVTADEAVDAFTAEQQDEIQAHWPYWGRLEQQLPTGGWTYWLIKAGRGWGKTRTGSEAVRQWAHEGFDYINLIAATADDARDIMVEGESGILAVCPKRERPLYIPSKRRLEWPNGARSLIFTADEPDRLRGKQHQKLWADELAAWRFAESWDQAKFGLRIGNLPQAIITTTPRPTRIVREIMADAATVVTNGRTYENRQNLAPSFFAAVLKKYEGTRLGRQEIDGEVLDDNPNGLFQSADIEQARVREAPQLQRIVVAIDPAGTSKKRSDETGIVVAGVQGEHGYILADRTVQATPEKWASEAIKAYHDFKADIIVAETNYGGEMVASVIRGADPRVPVRTVTASRGKAIRAEPVSMLYEQHRIHHVGMLAKLEDQMTQFDPMDETAKSPDRMDAMVWAITELMLDAPNTALIDHLAALQSAQQTRTETHGATSWRD